MPGRVLVVDDDAPTRMLLIDLLEGHEVQEAAGGAEALAWLATEHPDVILLDLLMPGVDGWAFAAAYRHTPPPHAPLIVLSAAAIAPERVEAIAPAATLSKPFERDDLLSLVRQYSRSALAAT